MGKSMAGHLDGNLEAANSALIEIQNLIRSDFEWDVSSDRESANDLALATTNFLSTNNAVERLKRRFVGVHQVVILGAAVEPSDILSLDGDCLFVAADGSVGVLDELPEDLSESVWKRLALVVSDGDGGDATLNAGRKAIPFALHAHGDNKDEWKSLLPILDAHCETLIITHQCPEDINGMQNPGGFTDGDRAVCIVVACGVPMSNITLLGFQSNSIGRWTGVTEPVLKLRKLKWMDEVLQLLMEGVN
ncbi:MAG TPA: hypothetical protein QF802_03180 [Candidatus Thalassarchaeaceae archaeon]|nr:hypothetical protein [Candidatus Thalassarchaeaceae archaeon]